MVQESSGIQPNSNRLQSTIDRLIGTGHLVEIDSQLRVAEAVDTEFSIHEEETLASEDTAYSKFEELANEHGLGDQVTELWSVLEEEVVLPLIEHMGARAYGFLNPSLQKAETIGTRIDKLVERHSDNVRVLFGAFLDPTDSDVRAFVLRRLNAQYVLTAGALAQEELDHLAQLTVIPSRIDVFLDTNFLLSILGLHDDPTNAVAVELLGLVEDLKNRLNLKLYVLPVTIQETQRVIRSVTMWLSEFRAQQNLARAASKMTSKNVIRHYFEELQRSPTLTPEDFFLQYDSGLIPLLRAQSVEYFNTDLGSLRTDQEVIDDLLSQKQYQAANRPQGAKSYESNLHDMVLWHFANRHRGTPRELVLETPSWIVTIDYGFIGFDKHKRRSESMNVPLCLHPSSLIHLFQFWVPSSTRLDEALVGSLRQPLLFLDFDIESEQVTLRILAQLSHYTNSDNLDPDVTAEILTNSALRKRIESAPADRSADEQIVREELPQVFRDLGEAVIDLRSQLEQANRSLKSVQERAASADSERFRRQAAEEALRRSDDQVRQTAEDNEKLVERVEILEAANRKQEKDLKRQQTQARRRAENRQLAVSSLVLLCAVMVVVLAGQTLYGQWLPDRRGYAITGAVVVLVTMAGIRYTIKDTRFVNHRIVKWLAGVSNRDWLRTLIMVVIGQVVAGVILWILGIL